MKKVIFYLAIMLITVFLQPAIGQNTMGAEKLGWKIGSQAYTFRVFTLEEALDKMNSLGLKYVELYGNQKIGAGIEGTTDFKMSDEKRQQVKALLKSKGITPVCFGVSSPDNPEDWRKLFEFAKDMGIGILTSEPQYNQLDLVEELCEEYQIKVAIHDHPIPSKYWHPEIPMRLLEGRSPLIGVCADIGHWVRSGLDPVECLKKVQDRLISFHFKDLKDFGIRNTHDVPWGSGVSNIPGVLNTMKDIGFEGPISIEYEHNWENSVPEIKESLDYFHRVANALAERE
ncbi:sugar phosphate isomerase/epimerase family protein [Membranihabitans maritimus]|uniref:sugar phosphate isomerase/epimerase family protein n=1 Tax=Membranihabitans maritimus TaxID=2904244 RepID=UPI001F1C2F5F|nr:sugar phosphate isomerase/epimerase [Membranihabitans maritimus]